MQARVVQGWCTEIAPHPILAPNLALSRLNAASQRSAQPESLAPFRDLNRAVEGPSETPGGPLLFQNFPEFSHF